MSQKERDPFLVALGQRLREARHRSGLTQDQAAERIPIGRSTLAGWESGVAAPDPAKLVRIAEVYGVSLDWLLRGESDLGQTAPEPDSSKGGGGLPMEERLLRVLEGLAESLRTRDEIERQRNELERLRIERVDAVRAQAERERETSISRLLDAILAGRASEIRREQAAADDRGRGQPLAGAAAAGGR